MSNPTTVGFVVVPGQQAPPANYYPAPGYPPQQPMHQQYPAGYPPPQYNPYPQPGHQQPHPSHQPFPPPMQQQPAGHHGSKSRSGLTNWATGSFHTYLQNATSFHVKQKVELLEALVGWETGNKYTVKDQDGHKVFYVGEESNMCGRQLFSASRPFTLNIKDATGADVIIMDRPLNCSCFGGLFCPDKLEVSTPSGQRLGSVVQDFSIFYPCLLIKDASDRTVLKIEGPLCPMSFGPCVGSVVFKVLNMNGVPVGTISKEWSGAIRELFTDADFFSISFPFDLDPAIKAVCLGALFLVDFEYFEDKS